MPDMELESALGGVVVGIDECGRGCIAGDVVAAAVVIPDSALFEGPLRGVNDSKKLTARRRRELNLAIREHCIVSIGTASPAEIDRLNILQATFLAMRRAFDGLPGRRPDHALVDGNRLPSLPCPATAVVRGDSKSVSVAAASIVAKHYRDERLTEMGVSFPGYGWERNAGYPTEEHYAAIERLGVTSHHRLSFAGVLRPRI